jgi:hypothetical protein
MTLWICFTTTEEAVVTVGDSFGWASEERFGQALVLPRQHTPAAG